MTTTYPSQIQPFIRTLRGATVWLACWTIATTTVLALRWPTNELWSLFVAVIIPTGLTARILRVLAKREHTGRVPDELETFLFDLALSLPLLASVMLLSAAKA